MDSITSALLNFGIGGVMAAAVVFMVWHNTAKTIPSLMQEVSEGRERFLMSLRELEQNCHEEINKTNEIWAGKFDKLSDEMRAFRVRRSEG